MKVTRSALVKLLHISAALAAVIPIYPVIAEQGQAHAAMQEGVTANLADLSESERQDLITQITEIANSKANERSWFEQDLRPLSIKVGLNIKDNGISFDMEGRLSHEAGFDDMSDLHRAIENTLLMLENARDIHVFEWTYGGRSLEDILQGVGPAPVPFSSRRAAVEPGETVIVAAGHGRYHHHGYKDWRPHREVRNGVLEDDVTPKFADELTRYLRLAQFDVAELRPNWPSSHEPSGLSWGRLGARYFLEQWKPAVPSAVWHSLPGASDPGRERREDILSRPLYANHVNAGALIHLHTNADDNPAASGVRVIVHPRRNESAELGKLALCSMREMIHSDDRFKLFPVAESPHVVDDKAENAKASMPSIIVETGFHTNPSDAEFIKDPEFRKASMMGVAKAYKLFKEGRSCENFEIVNAADFAEAVGSEAKIPVTLKGNPIYPLRIRYLPSRCRREPCVVDSTSISGPSDLERFRIKHYCMRDDIEKGPIEYTVSVQDFWGARTESKVFRLTCTPKAATF